MSYPRAIIRDFKAGWNTQDLPAELTENFYFDIKNPSFDRPNLITGSQYPVLRNLFVTHLGRLQLRGGMHKITPDIGASPQGISRYYAPTSENLMIAVGGQIRAYNEALAIMQTLQATANPGALIDFTSLYGDVYWGDGLNAPQKWDSVAATSLNVGIAPPRDAPGVSVGGGGNLTSTGAGEVPYQWFVTFYNTDTGLESNPSPASFQLNLTSQQGALSGIPISSDPQVNARNIYRFGGSVSQQLLVTTIPDNTTTVYNDNTADAILLVQPTTLEANKDQPPAGIGFFVAHKDRLWGAGHPDFPCRLWYSTFGQPNYFPQVILDPVNDGAFLDIDLKYDDPIIAGADLGSLLAILRKKSIYIAEGDTAASQNPFIFRRVGNQGCAARRSAVLCNNQLVYLGSDAMVYVLQDGKSQAVALPLENTLKAVPSWLLPFACACYHDQRYLLFIPQLADMPPVNIGFDFRAGSWFDLSDPELGGNCLYAEEGEQLFGEALFGTKQGYLWTDGTSYNGVVSALTQTDPLTPITIAFQTPDLELGRPSWTKRAKALRLEGILAQPPDADAASATITAYTPGYPPASQTFDLIPSASGGVLLDTELAPYLIGRRLNVAINGTVTSFELQTIDLAFAFIREKS